MGLSIFKNLVAPFVLDIWFLFLTFLTNKLLLYLFFSWPFIQILWEPYKDVLNSLPTYCIANQHIWRSVVPLIYFCVVKENQPKHVFRQFGIKQLPPSFVDTSAKLHMISHQGKYDKDWVVEHAFYIQQWANRGQCVCDEPILSGDMMYLYTYMKWYLKITRRFIT